MDDDRCNRLGDDVLKGIEEIAAFLGEKFNRTHRLCLMGKIPVGKQLGRWTASKRVLREHYARLTSGGPDAAA